MHLSIIIPSLRPNGARHLADLFHKIIKVDYEFIVVSTYDIDGPNVVLIKEEKPRGIYKAVCDAMNIVKGDYVLHMPDDAAPKEGAIEKMIQFSEQYQDNIFLGCFMVHDGPFVFEQGAYYGFPFSGFPFMKRRDIDKIEYLMDPYYSSFYGDPDLAIRVAEAGGIFGLCEEAWMTISSPMDVVKTESMSKYENDDKGKFIARWSPKYGNFTDYQHYSKIRTEAPV